MLRRTAAALIALLLLLPAVPALAAPARASFIQLERKTMCIECNVPLDIAESAQADATRVEIHRLIDQGLDEKQILNALVAEYGPNILAAPRAKGFNLLAYVIPVAAVVAFVAVGLLLLPRWKANRRTAAPALLGPDLDPREASRLDDELARYGH